MFVNRVRSPNDGKIVKREAEINLQNGVVEETQMVASLKSVKRGIKKREKELQNWEQMLSEKWCQVEPHKVEMAQSKFQLNEDWNIFHLV